MNPTNPNYKAKPFTCPKCDAGLNLETRFTGWEIESIDPKTGEVDEVRSGERDSVHSQILKCSSGCGWETAYDDDEDDFTGEFIDEQLPESLTDAGEIAIPNASLIGRVAQFSVTGEVR